MEGLAHGAVAALLELAQFMIGPGGPSEFGHIEPRQGPDPVMAMRIPEWLIVWVLHERVALARFAQEGEVALGVQTLRNGVTLAIRDAKRTFVELQAAILVHRAQEQ